ncbi:MAG TPA: protein translocase subunit SecF [bacterium]|nr:protein translocase subunit SecF [bacterium]
MQLIKHDLNINFTGNFKLAATISTIAVLAGIILMIVIGPNYGVDFKGGTEIQIKVAGIDIAGVRAALSDFDGVEIQQFEGHADEFTIKLPSIALADAAEVDRYIGEVQKALPDTALIKKHFNVEVGDRIELWFDKPIDREQLSALVTKYNIPVTGQIDYNAVGERHIYKILLKSFTSTVIAAVEQKAGSQAEIQRVELVGPKVGAKLRTDTFMAIVYTLIAMLIYIALRFNFQSAPGAIIALFHDTMITLGILVVFRVTFDLTIVAALLTMVGYSINDTVVVYDRIRENQNNPKKGNTLLEKINTSINETLSRTIITSAMTFIVVFTLLMLGGDIIWGFAFTMCIGIVVGTYSSIFIASPITAVIDNYMKKEQAT